MRNHSIASAFVGHRSGAALPDVAERFCPRRGLGQLALQLRAVPPLIQKYGVNYQNLWAYNDGVAVVAE